VVNLILTALEALSAQQRAARLLLCIQARLSKPAARPVRVGADGHAAASPAAAVREIAITVSDTGPGVPEELHERIFYPFFTTKERGSGVGLALAQKFVASHGGVLELESGLGSGATFRVRLPVSGEDGA
jgi:signal transduction histidine kinase